MNPNESNNLDDSYSSRELHEMRILSFINTLKWNYRYENDKLKLKLTLYSTNTDTNLRKILNYTDLSNINISIDNITHILKIKPSGSRYIYATYYIDGKTIIKNRLVDTS